LLFAAVALFVWPAVAHGDLGVSFAGCVTADESVAAKGPCVLAPPPSNFGSAMNFPSAMGLSPDASSLYATGSFTSSVVHYQRQGASGALSFSDCLTGNFGGPCNQIATVHTTTDSGLDLVNALAVSHDGRFVYTTSGANGGDSTVMSFARDPLTGSLSFRSCVTGSTEMNNANPGVCTMLPGAPPNPTMPSPALDRPTGIAISPNDRFIYVSLEFGIATFQRDPSSGTFSFEGCLTSLAATSPPCVHARTNVVDDSRTPLIAPDGQSLYLADQHGGNVATFNLDPANGSIGFRSCITENSRLQPSCTLARTARSRSYGRARRAHRPGVERKRSLAVRDLQVRIAGGVQTQSEQRQPDRDGVHGRRARIPRLHGHPGRHSAGRGQRPGRRPGDGGEPERSPALRCGGRGFLARRLQAQRRKREAVVSRLRDCERKARAAGE
jgi:hypothetical protein